MADSHALLIAEIVQLKEQNRRLREALEDILRYDITDVTPAAENSRRKAESTLRVAETEVQNG